MFVLVAALTVLLSHDTQAFYNSSTGRWLSRDPIEEDGGPNIIAATSNDPANRVDAVGAKTLRLGVGFDSSVKFGPSVVKAVNGQLKFLFDMFFHCWTENKDCSCRLSESLPAVSIEWDYSTAIRAPADGIYNLLGDGYNLLVNNAKSIKGGRIKYLYTNARLFNGKDARAV